MARPRTGGSRLARHDLGAQRGTRTTPQHGLASDVVPYEWAPSTAKHGVAIVASCAMQGRDKAGLPHHSACPVRLRRLGKRVRALGVASRTLMARPRSGSPHRAGPDKRALARCSGRHVNRPSARARTKRSADSLASPARSPCLRGEQLIDRTYLFQPPLRWRRGDSGRSSGRAAVHGN